MRRNVCSQWEKKKMHNGNVAFKAFVICMVLFCAYMQWSPVVDLDYVWINGHTERVAPATTLRL